MELDDLAKLVKEKHSETQEEIGKLGEKVDKIDKNQVAIRTELDKSIVRKEDCYKAQNACRNVVYDRIRADNQGIKQEIAQSSQTVKEYLTGIVKQQAKANGNGGIPMKYIIGLISTILALAALLVYVLQSNMGVKP